MLKDILLPFCLIALPNIVLSGRLAANTEPIYDRFGQFIHADFPEKVHDEAELKADAELDEAYYAAFSPPELDIYGGLLGTREEYGLEATGFFRLDQIDDRWVLVTPEGNIYFALQVGGLFSYHDWVLVRGREELFEWLPDRASRYRRCYQGGQGQFFSFYLANWIRKFGSYNPEAWKRQWVNRLRRLGFNGHNAYGAFAGISRDTGFPMTIVLQGIRVGDPDFVYGFFDPFNEASRQRVAREVEAVVSPFADEPTILGYYIQNEADFSFLPLEIPQLGADYPAKQRLVEMLQKKYLTIEAFNDAWDMQAESFACLLEPIQAVTTAALNDMQAYKELFLHEYFRFVRDTVRQYDENHLLLGSRSRARDGRSDLVNRVAGHYIDVLSINYYCYHFEKEALIRAYENSGRPFILSEWSYDTREQGMPNVLREVETQEARGKAYRNYVEQAASLPFIVGVQWWCMLDHQANGWNTGLVNVADRPYRDFLAEVVKTNHDIYAVKLGQREPFAYQHPLFQEGAGRQRKVVDVPRALPGMQVDGRRLHWPDRPSSRITGRNLVVGPDSGEIEADFWLCWDDERLYIFIDVHDPTPRSNNHVGRGIWRGDAVEVFMGRLTDQPGMGIHDRQLLISASRKRPPAYYWYNSPSQFETEIVVIDAPGGQGYIIEAGIPFAAFNHDPQAGDEILFDVAVDDCEGEGRIRQFAWNGTAENSTNRAYWGRARLGQ